MYRIKSYFKNIIQKKVDEIKVSNSYCIAAAITNHETFAKLKNCNAEREVALCGAGPTLNKYRPIRGAVHVALNRALLNDSVQYDWFIADDWIGINFMQEQLINYDCKKFFGHQIGCLEREIPESFRIKCHADRYYTDSFMNMGFNSDYVCDIDRMVVGNLPNIALSAMQIILFTNPKVIYLVGCDASNNGHFTSGCNSNEKRINEEIEWAIAGDKVIQKWKDLKLFAEAYYPNTRIVSINPVGLRGIFEDIDQK